MPEGLALICARFLLIPSGPIKIPAGLVLISAGLVLIPAGAGTDSCWGWH